MVQKISFTGEQELHYKVHFKKDEIYVIEAYHKNIDIDISLNDEANQKISSTDLADGNNGTDRLEYEASSSGIYTIIIKSVSPRPVQNGMATD
ncbi:hypothetical protein [Pedobacter agri]|uniref:Uncharacterized protein n=1 Tax=Pedobacter agri TaxID=454586 RepID=A0A9X3I8K7_9SPHI|nr:hypothetical protein [Pedobacter agri]MCX3264851.1 hypothetical protein [Pedobacter agri]